MGLFRVDRTWYLDMGHREGEEVRMPSIPGLSSKMMESFRSLDKEHVQCGGPKKSRAGGTCGQSKCKDKDWEPQDNQGARESRGQRGEPDSRVNSPLNSIHIQGYL